MDKKDIWVQITKLREEQLALLEKLILLLDDKSFDYTEAKRVYDEAIAKNLNEQKRFMEMLKQYE